MKAQKGYMDMNMQFDNHDSRIKYYELMLERDLACLPCFTLPDGYRFVFYHPGDCGSWIEIEKSAKEFASDEQGMEAWNKYYAANEDMLPQRMVFIENGDGRKVATATAYYDVLGRDTSGDAWLHWVAVHREYQGKGLSKPLVSYVLGVMRRLGYTHAKIPTQTTSWVACKVYLDLGFGPIPKNAINSRKGWEIVKALTGHPALDSFSPAAMEDILAKPTEG